jgi:RNA polymerase sigma-70 factor, ECF subfamily
VPEGREAAFEAFYRCEYSSVVRAAYLITGDAEEARDVAQEAFARAYERWRSVAKLERPGAWAQRVAVNLAVSWRRRQRARLRSVLPVPGSTVAPDEGIPDVVAALRHLPPAQRAVVVLRYYADYSIAEVARILGKPPATVRALSAKGTAALRKRLSAQEAAP